MPRLPDYTDLGARPAPVSNRGVASNEQAGAPGQAIQGLGQTVSNIGQHFLEKQDKLNLAAAKAEVLKGDIELRKKLQDDPDFETWEQRYTEGMKAVREKAGGMIQSRSDRGVFDADSELDALRGSAELAKVASGRRSQARVGVGMNTLNTLQDVGQDALDDATREQTIVTAGQTVDAMVGRGDITPERGIELKRTWTQNYILQQVQVRKDRGDIDGAEKYFQANKGRLDPGAEMRLGEQIQGAKENRADLTYADTFFDGPSEAPPAGLVTPGTIDLHARPVVKNADGSISTVRSISIEEDGKTILIPTVVGNKVVSDKEAVAEYHRTGQHLGVFKDEKSATAYAQSLHEEQAQEYGSAPAGGALGVGGVAALAHVPVPAAKPGASAAPIGRQSYLSKLRGAENNAGNPNAKNARSSASGNYQFTDDTFVNTYRAAFPGDQAGRAQILVRKNEPALQERLANKLTDMNTAALKAAGHVATGGNLYLAHFAGSEGANKVLNADASASVESVLGAKVVNANPFLRGKTVGWLRGWAGRKMGETGSGEVGSAASGPNTYQGPVGPDTKAIDARIDADAQREGWTPEQKARRRSMVMARANEMRQQANQAQEETFNRALAKADALGGTFTDVSQLGDDFYKASATDQHRLRTMAQANLEAQSKPEGIPANGDAIRKLKVLAAGTPADAAKLAGINLAEYRPLMTPAEYEEISVAQARAKADLAKPKPGEEAWNPRTGIQAAMSWGKEFGGVELKNDEEKFRVYRFMATRAREWSAQNGNKKPGDNEYQSFFREATNEVRVTNRVFGLNILPDGTKRGQTILSPAYRQMITRQFRAAKGRDPSEEEMQAWFEKMGEAFR